MTIKISANTMTMLLLMWDVRMMRLRMVMTTGGHARCVSKRSLVSCVSARVSANAPDELPMCGGGDEVSNTTMHTNNQVHDKQNHNVWRCRCVRHPEAKDDANEYNGEGNGAQDK
eukprot:15445037-Alexandrium_andersonii.AAC.1